MSLSIQQLAYMHADKETLFSGLNLSVNNNEKIALVGHNGSGKSTLMRIISGAIPPTSGQVVLPPDGLFYVPQHFGQYNNLTIAQAMQIDEKLNALQAILGGQVDEIHFATLNDEWNIEEDALEALQHWGLQKFTLTQPMHTLSGGEKTKVFLAGMQLHPHSILLLDEPTNHLDYSHRQKLYNFVQSTQNGMIIVSHDRTLLNLLPITAELTAKGINIYGGNYEFYKEQKEKLQSALVQQLEEKEKQLRIAKKVARETVERQQKHSSRGEKQSIKKGVPRIVMGNMKSASEKTSGKLKDIHAEKTGALQTEVRSIREKAATLKSLQTDFNSSALHQGKILVTAKDINYAYSQDHDLWKEPLNFEIRSGNRINIEGDNGSGKTTLLKLITGRLQPTRGTITRTDGINYVYMDQEYSLIKNEKTLLQQAEEYNTQPLPDHEIKTILNRFLFPVDTWNKPCSKLSGGEKMRLAFCCLMIANNTPDLFILDEPTNNLDIASIEIITNTIEKYRGTVIVISHDKYFLNEIRVDQVLKL
ncbi:ATP-binding cassette domain-containing protein [Bacteroides sp. OttesenSCG-928-D19]|nr:ATP-binding cassette domain-containing protein [Bacteroides sp. OttesenSCG-928-D19]